MKTTIFHFSGTGNSLKVAQDVANGLGDTTLVPIAKALKGEIDLSADRIGIVAPVYCWGLPIIVCDFVKKMKPAGLKYVFSVVTYGGSPAKTNLQIDSLLKERNMQLSAGFAVRMPGNAISVYGAWKEEKQKTLFTAEPQKIKEIVDYINANSTGYIEVGGLLMNAIGSMVYKPFMSKMKEADKSYIVEDTCTKCGICASICPVGNIKLVDGKPTWHQNCEQCMRCIQWCPVEAIQLGKATKVRKRYHHPSVKVADFE